MAVVCTSRFCFLCDVNLSKKYWRHKKYCYSSFHRGFGNKFKKSWENVCNIKHVFEKAWSHPANSRVNIWIWKGVDWRCKTLNPVRIIEKSSLSIKTGFSLYIMKQFFHSLKYCNLVSTYIQKKTLHNINFSLSVIKIDASFTDRN